MKYPVVLNYLFSCRFDLADLSLIAHVVLMAHDAVPLLPDRFDGSSSVDDWVSHFDTVAAINGWDEAEKLLWLKAHVIGKAHVAYHHFSHETRNLYALFKAALRERFEPASNRESYKVEFQNRERQSTESWADFGDTLLSLVDRAFPDLPDNAREALALERFLSQLNPLQISFAVRQRKTKCVREAVSATLEAESHLITYYSNNHQKQHNKLLREDKSPETIAIDTHLQQLEKMAKTLKDIQLRIGNCEITPSAIRESQPKVTSHHTIVCRKCKQMGHYARGCASNRQKRRR